MALVLFDTNMPNVRFPYELVTITAVQVVNINPPGSDNP